MNQTTSSGDFNSANNPGEPKLTLEYWNYYALSLNRLNGDAENGEGRVLIPFKVNGIQQVFHIDPQVVTAPAATSGPRTGLGDAQIYNFTLTKQDIGLPEKVTFGIGPLIAVPTNTSTNFGPNSLQGGVGGVIIAPQSWGLLGVLVTYQHTLWGASSELTTVQPNVFYNLDHGYYLRSSAIMQFNTYSHTDVVPVGFGAGKVIKLDGGYVLTPRPNPPSIAPGWARRTSRPSRASNYNSRRALRAAGISERRGDERRAAGYTVPL